MYPPLNLPEVDIKLKEKKIWDPIRKKYFLCTPEEWVRQHFLQYLIEYKNYPMGRMVCEHTVMYSGQQKRCDLALFNKELKVDVIVECKAPKVKLNEDTFYQIAKYCKTLQASFLILTNGLEHYCAFIDIQNNRIRFLSEIPDIDKIDELKNV